MLSSIIEWLEQNMLSCFYKKYFGLECFGCGMQRSLVALLKGELLESFTLFPALLPTLLMLLFLPLHLIFKFKHGAAILKYCFIFTAAIMVISFVIKKIHAL